MTPADLDAIDLDTIESSARDGWASPATVIAMIDEVRRLRDEAKWIACSERMPVDGQEVTFFRPDNFNGTTKSGVYRTHYSGERIDVWYSANDARFDGVTHWRPLPAPPLPNSEGNV